MKNLSIDRTVEKSIRDFKLPEKLGFGDHFSPAMYLANWRDSAWQDRKVIPFGPLEIYPSSKVLHYAQAIFEGFKAYAVAQNQPQVFRPKENWKRLNLSAERMQIPTLPMDLFHEAVVTIVGMSAPIIPKDANTSLYLRPLIFGNSPDLGIGPSSEYVFCLMASPSAAYCDTGMMRALIERADVRAAPGGTGHVKTAGNYAVSLHSAACAADLGCQMSLWLDPINRCDIEELSGMNIFFVVGDEIWTPQLTGTLLPGITRSSVIELARAMGHTVLEKAIHIDEILALIKSDDCSEGFATGTAATITPIKALVEHDGTDIVISDQPGPTTMALREQLLGIQEGRLKDRFGWMINVPEYDWKS